MRLFVVLLAASLVAAAGPEGQESRPIVYQVKFLEMSGLGWRSSLYTQLQPVARQGPATVWTASRETASKLAEKAEKVVAAPRVTQPSHGRCTVVQNSIRKVVAEVTREADGPVNHASFVGFVPRVEDATEGYSAEVTGRTLDQGVLASLTLVDRRITAIHTVPLTEVLESKAGREGETTTPVEVTIQIPECARTEVSGEWLIPKNGVLVVSLGVHTVADPKGKAVAHERLAVFEADEADGPVGVATDFPRNPDLPLLRAAVVGLHDATPPPMYFPDAPGRSLPRATDAAGQPVELPPLPEDETTVTMLPGSSEPCASPQAKGAAGAGEPIPWKKSQIRDHEADLTAFRSLPDDDSVKYFPVGPDFPWANTQASQHRGSDDKAPPPPCCEAGAGAYCTEDDWASTGNTSPDAGTPVKPATPPGEDSRNEDKARIKPKPSGSSSLNNWLLDQGSGRERVKYPVRWRFDD